MHAPPHPLADLSVALDVLDQDHVVAVRTEDPDVLLGNPLVVVAAENPDVAVVADEHHPAHLLVAVLAAGGTRRPS